MPNKKTKHLKNAHADMEEFLSAWLASDWNTKQKDQFFRYLQDLDMPPGDRDEAAFRKLFNGIPKGRKRCEARKKLACRVKLLLDDKPDQTRPGTYPDVLLYNLLHLCASLRSPDELAEPLLAIYQRRVLDGSYNGIDLRCVLRSALTYNQNDRTMEADWFTLIDTGAHDFLGGDLQHGFEGLVMMPPDGDEEGPVIDAIVRALRTATEKGENVGQLIAICEHVHPSVAVWEDLLVADEVSSPISPLMGCDESYDPLETRAILLNMFGHLNAGDLLNDMTAEERDMLQTRHRN